MTYENMLREADQQGIYTYEKSLKPNIKGLYSDKVICINKNIPTQIEKSCILAEELGHYHTSSGDIVDQSKLLNRRQEIRARNWAYEKLIPLSAIIEAHYAGIGNKQDLIEFLDVTPEFLEAAIERYQQRYGKTVTLDQFTICFEPLGVLEMFE